MFLAKERAYQYLCSRIDLNKTYSDLLLFPSYIILETVADCNAKCRMCPLSKSKNNIMTDMFFYKIMEEILQNRDKIKHINIQGRGEPLLDRKIFERIHFISKENNIKTTLSTNVSLLDKRKGELLLKAGIGSIILSIDSLKEDNYRKIRRGLNFKEVLNNALYFIELRNRIASNTQIHIRMIKQSINSQEWDDFYKFWISKINKNDRVSFKSLNNVGTQLKLKEVNNIKTDQIYFPCISLWGTFFILFNGKVLLCLSDHDDEVGVIGDLYKNTISSIWRGEKLMSYRKLHLDGRKEPYEWCSTCNIWEEPIDSGEHKGKKFFPELYRHM